MEALGVLLAAYLAGAIPFSQLASRLTGGADLREVDTGTVSGTNLYKVAGFGPLAVAGILEIAKGAVGPLLATGDRPELAALAGGLAVVGHNWSPFLRFAGGRGISPAMGAMLVTAWPGAALLMGGMIVGRLAGQTALGSFVSYVLLVPLLALTDGPAGVWVGICVVVPMLLKRLVGNAAPESSGGRVYLTRLLYDRDHVTQSPSTESNRHDR
ncbi:MAG: Glycerol-3-phosphate acyltransferase [Acidimicrobiales bacterium]|nr:Glycerol-3-phosphate acyltransferase [Acidimicrobiales bacterium]